MTKYVYNGPVLLFGNCVASNWKGETIAASEEKARSNLAYQYKRKNNLNTGIVVKLPGKIEKVE